MPRGGSNKKSKDLQVLEGGDRADRVNNPPEIKEKFPVRAPDWLPEYARIFWDKYAPMLDRAGMITGLDEALFQVTALTYNTIMLCEKSIDEDGINVPGARGGMVKNPAISTLNAARQQFRLQCQQFGLDPGSRERLNVTEPGEKTKMEQWLDMKR